METKTNDFVDNFMKVLLSVWGFFYTLITKAPITFGILVILLYFYYRGRYFLFKKFKNSGKITKLPYSVQYYLDTFWLKRSSLTSFVMLIVKILELVGISVLILYLLELIGLTVPPEVLP
jgi:hypothetical protein